MGAPLSDKASAKEAWDSIATAHISVDRVRHATLQWLRKDWENLAFRPGEQIKYFALRLSTMK
jgi:predicted AlkP superfamily phosphohydrolase/phosphomutase